MKGSEKLCKSDVLHDPKVKPPKYRHKELESSTVVCLRAVKRSPKQLVEQERKRIGRIEFFAFVVVMNDPPNRKGWNCSVIERKVRLDQIVVEGEEIDCLNVFHCDFER